MSTGTLYAEAQRHTYLDAPVDVYHRRLVGVLLAGLGLTAGQRVLEVGAGSGRYTRALLDLGLEVVALEPDPALYAKLEEQLGSAGGARLLRAGVGELPETLPDVQGLCGFHVLHHFDAAVLRALAGDLRRLARGSLGFRGWFFMEPNPWNLLYPVQIGLRPGMRFREERGIWTNDYARLFAGERVGFEVFGHIGLLPPALCRRLPARVLRALRPRLRRGPSLTALYRVMGGRAA